MNWRFWEKREGYTDTIINALIQAAEGSARNAHATAALESAAGLYQAAFSAAKVEPAQEALGPCFLGEAEAADPIWTGCLSDRGRGWEDPSPGCRILEYRSGEGPRSSEDVEFGGPEEIICQIQGPTSAETIKVPSSGVIHFRYAVDPLRPWEGLGPLQSASATGTLMGALEQRLGEESAAPSALLLPIPADGGDGGEGDPLANLKADIAKAKGRPVLLKTTAGGFGEGPGNAPQRDWQQSRIGANPPEVLVNLRKESTLSVMSACQVPISLITDADGTSQREAWRRFVMGSVEPLSQRMAEELSRKLDLPNLDFKFRSLWASDLIGRTQAFQRLVQGGMGIQEAVSAAGIMAE